MEQSDIERLIGELEIALDRLRSLYDQYFVGLEKIEPAVVRKDVDRRVYTLRKEQIRNTALRFRFQTVLQRYNTYQTHWQRVCREIENGTYKRHMMRAQRRYGSTRPPPARRPSLPPLAPRAESASSAGPTLAELGRQLAPEDFEVDVEVVSSRNAPPLPAPTALPRPAIERSAPRPTTAPARPVSPPLWKKVGAPAPSQPQSTPPPASQAPPPRPPPPRPVVRAPVPVAPAPQPLPPVPGEERVRQLYAELVETKRRQNESTAAITYQSVARSIRESSDRLHKKHGKPVDFEVTVKDGKTFLKPLLK